MYEFVRAFQKGKSAKSIKEFFFFQNFPSLIRQPTEKGCVFLEPIINRLEVAMKIILWIYEFIRIWNDVGRHKAGFYFHRKYLMAGVYLREVLEWDLDFSLGLSGCFILGSKLLLKVQVGRARGHENEPILKSER